MKKKIILTLLSISIGVIGLWSGEITKSLGWELRSFYQECSKWIGFTLIFLTFAYAVWSLTERIEALLSKKKKTC